MPEIFSKATSLKWNSFPDILVNDEPLLDVINKLQEQISSVQSNQMLNGDAIPPWMLQALSEVASSVDSVVECQALRDQVSYVEKELLGLKHEILLQQSSSNSARPKQPAYSPTPHHRMSMKSKQQPPHRDVDVHETLSDLPAEITRKIEWTNGESQGNVTAAEIEQFLQPLWKALHKQANDFSGLREAFLDAKETVARLQAELKRRDAVTQARTSKHEQVFQSHVDKLKDSLRSCVTRNDLALVQQQISEQIKSEGQLQFDRAARQHNDLHEKLLSSQAEQEDVNSSNAELLQILTRQVSRIEEGVAQLHKNENEAANSIGDLKKAIVEISSQTDEMRLQLSSIQDSVTDFERTQKTVEEMGVSVQEDLTMQDLERKALEEKLFSAITETAGIFKEEAVRIDSKIDGIINENLSAQLSHLEGKMQEISYNFSNTIGDTKMLQENIEKGNEEIRIQFTEAFSLIYSIQEDFFGIVRDTQQVSRRLDATTDSTASVINDLAQTRQFVSGRIDRLDHTTQHIGELLGKTIQSTDNEINAMKRQIYYCEESSSGIKIALESMQIDVTEKFSAQVKNNKAFQVSIETLASAQAQLNVHYEQSDARIATLQAENHSAIETSTSALTRVVQKESERVEAFYLSYQKKHEQFADIVARSSIRNMTLIELNKELDRIGDVFVNECWKFEISERTSNRSNVTETAPDTTTASRRKLFNERQQQLLVQNCQFFADLIVASAEYDSLRIGCNQDIQEQKCILGMVLTAQETLVGDTIAKIQRKIMNNKNTGEQFDSHALQRRALFIKTFIHLIDASIKRRTLAFPAAGENSNNESVVINIGEVKSTHTNTKQNELAFTQVKYNASHAAEQESARTLTPSMGDSSLRGGFRIRKALLDQKKSEAEANIIYTSDTLAANRQTNSSINSGPDKQISFKNTTLATNLELMADAFMCKSVSLPVLKTL